jgi:hypothetical protein
MIKKITNNLSNDSSAADAFEAMDNYAKEILNRVKSASFADIEAALLWWDAPEEEGGISYAMKISTIVGLYNTVVDQVIDALETGEEL